MDGIIADRIAAFRRMRLEPTKVVTAIAPEQSIRKQTLMKTTVPGYTVAGPILTPIEKQFQAMVIARDWNSLFTFLPPKMWGLIGMLGKYSFINQNGRRIYKPFSQDDLRRWIFSNWYLLQPGWECSDAQREAGVQALWKASYTHIYKFPPTRWEHIYPIFPGRIYCKKPTRSLWVKIRKPVAIAVGVVAAVYLGPIVYDKISGVLAGASESGGIVGAGTKAGTAVKAGVTAEKVTLLAKVQTGVQYYNKAIIPDGRNYCR